MITAYNYDKIYSKIDKAELVSFDIFDTLIKRNVLSPGDIFEKVQHEYNRNEANNINDFVQNRIYAQKKLRLQHEDDDYSIEEVYLLLEKIYNKEIAQRFLTLEKNIEMKYCIRNYDFYKIYEYCRKNNKKIICISDMYFDKEFIEQILNRNGYQDIKDIYVSCDYNQRKATGRIYETVYKNLCIKKKEWLHIGDSLKSDFLQARIKGINSYHIKTEIINTTYLNKEQTQSLDDRIVYSLINNNINKDTNNNVQKVGYEVFGPLLYGYIRWLKIQFEQQKVNKVFFCSRDMKLVCDAFQKYFSNFDSNYLYISRKSIRGAYLHKYNSFEDFHELITEEELNIGQILKVLNVDINIVADKLERYNLEVNSIIKFKNIPENFIYFYNDIITEIEKANEKKYSIFIKYMKQEDFVGNVGLIDTGWNATTQYCLSKLLEDVNINGFYFGLEQKAYDRVGKEKINSYIFSPIFNHQFKDKINSFKIVFETIISHNISSVVGYKEDGKIIKPIFETENTDTADYIEDVQKGIRKSINLLFNFDSELNINMDFAISALNKFIIDPSISDSRKFIVLKNKNFEKEKSSLGPTHSIFYYFFNLKKLYSEFHQSVWKVAYLKILFKIGLPYYKIYVILKKRREK